MSFSNKDPIHQYSGKLYWIGRGSFQSTLTASLNLIISAMIISNDSIVRFETQFGFLSPIMILFLLPMPGFFLILSNGKNQEQLYDLISEKILSGDETPHFVLLTSELYQKIQRYSEDYFKQIDLIKKSVFEYIKGEFPEIAPFYDSEQSYHLNLENLALFITKKTIPQVMGENKNNP